MPRYTELWQTTSHCILIDSLRSLIKCGRSQSVQSETQRAIPALTEMEEESFIVKTTHERWTHRVPSAFQLTLYGFFSRKQMFCLSMDTGWAPGKPALQQQRADTSQIRASQSGESVEIKWMTVDKNNKSVSFQNLTNTRTSATLMWPSIRASHGEILVLRV